MANSLYMAIFTGFVADYQRLGTGSTHRDQVGQKLIDWGADVNQMRFDNDVGCLRDGPSG